MFAFISYEFCRGINWFTATKCRAIGYHAEKDFFAGFFIQFNKAKPANISDGREFLSHASHPEKESQYE